MKPRPPILLYVTVKNKREALEIAKILLEEKLIACANITSPVTSVYAWEGDVQSQSEVLMLLKTTVDLQDQAILRVAALHSYECPCITALPVEAAYAPFARWIDAQVCKKD